MVWQPLGFSGFRLIPPCNLETSVCRSSTGSLAIVFAVSARLKFRSPAVSLRCAAFCVTRCFRKIDSYHPVGKCLSFWRRCPSNSGERSFEHSYRSVDVHEVSLMFVQLTMECFSFAVLRAYEVSPGILDHSSVEILFWILHSFNEHIARYPWGCTALGSPHENFRQLGPESFKVLISQWHEFCTKKGMRPNHGLLEKGRGSHGLGTYLGRLFLCSPHVATSQIHAVQLVVTILSASLKL